MKTTTTTARTLETIGCDLGDKDTTICVLGSDDTKAMHRIRTTEAGFRKFFTRPAAHVVIEVGVHSRWVSELLMSLGHEVTVANARKLKLISQSDSKSDDNDAELLARLGRADRKLLSPIQHRTKEAQADLAITKSRHVLVQTRTKLVNHIRGICKSFGVQHKKHSAESFHRKVREHIPAELKAALEPVFFVLETLEIQIKACDKTIQETAKKYPEIDALMQVNGIGTLTALVFMLTLYDKTRFQKSRHVGAYIGLRPKKQQSGKSDAQLRITKAGDPFLRWMLVQAAHYTMGPFGKDSDLKRWGQALCARGGKNAKKRATVAVARKLAVLLHRLWVTGEVYEPTGYAKKKTAA